MPSKAKEDNPKPKKKSGCRTCGPISPGPKYKLRTVTGFQEHCQSKLRYPAYTFGWLKKENLVCRSPGPKYMVQLPNACNPGYSFPKAKNPKPKECTPGPKYTLPGFTAPAYSIVPKPKPLRIPCTPGPKYPPFDKCCKNKGVSFGVRGKPFKCTLNPPIRDPGDINVVKPRQPAYTIVFKPRIRDKCRSPGPKYLPKIPKKAPEYTFGVLYDECTWIPRTECDDLC